MTQAGNHINVLLRLMFPHIDPHLRMEDTMRQLKEQGHVFWVSRQVIREYLVQITHPATFYEPIPPKTIRENLTQLSNLFTIADETSSVTSHLLHLVSTKEVRGKQIHDANIVATMLANEIKLLITLNQVDFTRYAEHITLVSAFDPKNKLEQ